MKLIGKDRFETLLNSFASIKPILVVGDVGVDKYTFGEVKRISPEAPVPVLEVTEEWFKLGLAANVSDNLRSLGVSSTICGVIGDDKNGGLLEELLEEGSLRTWGIVREKKRSTTLKERVMTNIQQICRIDYEGRHPLSDEAERLFFGRLDSFTGDHSAVIIEDYGKGLISEKVCNYLIKRFTDEDKIVAVDPSRTTPPRWYRGASILKPNRAEALLMAEGLGYRDEKNLGTVARILMDELDLSQLVITLGPEGMALMDRTLPGGKSDELYIIPTLANEVFDVSGAGDTAISAICASLVAGATLEEASWVGNCASGVVVGKKGTACVTQQELKDFHQHLSQKLAAKK